MSEDGSATLWSKMEQVDQENIIIIQSFYCWVFFFITPSTKMKNTQYEFENQMRHKFFRFRYAWYKPGLFFIYLTLIIRAYNERTYFRQVLCQGYRSIYNYITHKSTYKNKISQVSLSGSVSLQLSTQVERTLSLYALSLL